MPEVVTTSRPRRRPRVGGSPGPRHCLPNQAQLTVVLQPVHAAPAQEIAQPSRPSIEIPASRWRSGKTGPLLGDDYFYGLPSN